MGGFLRALSALLRQPRREDPAPAEAEDSTRALNAALKQAETALAAGKLALVLAITERWCRKPSPSPIAQGMRADALCRLGRSKEALELVDEALQGAPGVLPLMHVRTHALLGCDRFGEATEAAREILGISPDMPKVLCTLATGLVAQGEFDEALKALLRAHELSADDVEVCNSLAVVYMHLLRYDDALTCLRAALQRNVGDPTLLLTMASAVLATGDMAEGWKLYEGRPVAPPTHAPRWLQGMSVEGKCVLLLAEQGLGDTVQFARYVPEVLARGAASVVLKAPERVRPLFEGVWPGCVCVSDLKNLPAPDIECPLMSLPHVLELPQPLAPRLPYVCSAIHRRPYWRQRIGHPERFKVGLVWSGSLANPSDRWRTLDLDLLRAGLDGCDAHFVSLQYEVRESDVPALHAWQALQHIGDEQQDLADTAALIELMDVVVSVDTSVAHVAAAMGRPVLLLLCRNPDWRWRLDGRHSPWYPSVELFRQGSDRRWEPVLESVRERLVAMQQQAGHSADARLLSERART